MWSVTTEPSFHWQPSVEEALILCVLAVMAIVGLCASAALRKKKIPTEENGEQSGKAHVDVKKDSRNEVKQHELQVVASGEEARKGLISSLCWKNGSNLVVAEGGKTPKRMEVGEKGASDESGSRALLPVWQRKILMGERCQLPRFSGLILYDERGRPLQSSSSSNGPTPLKAKPAAPVTTLKDLL